MESFITTLITKSLSHFRQLQKNWRHLGAEDVAVNLITIESGDGLLLALYTIPKLEQNPHKFKSGIKRETFVDSERSVKTHTIMS